MSQEAVAVIGIGCRFPAGADTPSKFFKTLTDGKDIRTAPPVSRWSKAYAPLGDPSTTPVRGTYVDKVDQFDPAYFGLKDEEVEEMCAQQRLALEVCADTLRNAGYLQDVDVKGSLRGQSIDGKNDIGVFLGIATADSMCSAYQVKFQYHKTNPIDGHDGKHVDWKFDGRWSQPSLLLLGFDWSLSCG
jgi:acyl transferase domain-containing protein